MRKVLLAAALSLSLSGCATVPGGTPVPGGTIVTDVQNIARSICKFVPTAETILSLLSTFTGTSPFVSQATQIADAICAAVQQPASNKSLTQARRAPPTVNGVAIRGRFVR